MIVTDLTESHTAAKFRLILVTSAAKNGLSEATKSCVIVT